LPFRERGRAPPAAWPDAPTPPRNPDGAPSGLPQRRGGGKARVFRANPGPTGTTRPAAKSAPASEPKGVASAMSKREASKYKINRRLGVNLWGRPKSPINKRDYAPGQHGQRRRKPTDYGTQLAAKQKLKGYYG